MGMAPRIDQPTFAMAVIGVAMVVEQRRVDRRQKQYALSPCPLGQQMLTVGKDHFRVGKLRVPCDQPWHVEQVTHYRPCVGRVPETTSGYTTIGWRPACSCCCLSSLVSSGVCHIGLVVELYR